MIVVNFVVKEKRKPCKIGVSAFLCVEPTVLRNKQFNMFIKERDKSEFPNDRATTGND